MARTETEAPLTGPSDADAARREVEERLRESEARQRAIVDATPECVKIVGADGRLCYMNRAGLRMIDARWEEADGIDVAEVVAPHHRAEWLRNHARVCAGEPVSWEFDVVGLAGTRRRMETHAVPLPGPDGALQQLAVTRDVTERREAEERLRQSEALLAAFMKNAPVGMYLKDADGRYLLLNPEMGKVFGRPVEEVVGRTAAELFGPEEAAMIAGHDRRIMETGRARSVEEHLPGHDSYEWSMVLRFPVSLAGERPTRIGGFDIDVTERKRTELELARSRDMLHQSEKMTALGSLLAGVSHELNNPLSVVLTLSQLLEAQLAGTPLAERAGKIADAAGRCAKIVGSFLAMARQKAPARARVDLNDVVRSALDLAGFALRAADVAVVRELDPDLPAVEADGDQLAQVVLNLLVNAQHALEEKSGERVLTVRTEADRRRRTVSLSVGDNGPGVPLELRRRVFEPFFTSKPQGRGTGIGLTISLGLVEAHGGTLRLADPQGEGACFVIELPVATARMEREEAGALIDPSPGTGSALVVDDDPEVGDALAELLTREHYRVQVARSGAEAQTFLAERRFDVVLSDLRMPGLDGRALLEWIERERPDQVERLAFVTGDTLGAATSGFLARAGRPVLEKPFSGEALRRLLAELRRPGLDAAA